MDMPIDNTDSNRIPPRQPTDLLYGFDTGQIKYRTFYRKKYYPNDTDAQHKIDFYTQTMGPNPGTPLPPNWAADRTTDTPLKKEFRQFVVGGTKDAPFANRYNPELAKPGDEWNARFRRTSKAGLQWGLLAKHWNVHFIVNDMDFRDAVTKPTRGPDDKPVVLVKGAHAGNKNSRRITYCELRWLYRHREFDVVQQNVQFWRYEQKPDPHFEAIKAPWLNDPDMWKRYQPKLEHILNDYTLASKLPGNAAQRPGPRQPGTGELVTPEGRSQAQHLQLAAIRARELDEADDDHDEWI